MAQSYFPSRPLASEEPIQSKEIVVEEQVNMEDAVDMYLDRRNRLVHALDSTQSILKDLQSFNKDKWVVRYPHFKDESPEVQTSAPRRPKSGRRSMTFADDPQSTTEVMLKSRKGLGRSLTLAGSLDSHEQMEKEQVQEKTTEPESLIPESEAADFHVLRLDLKLGPHGSSQSAASLVSHLEKASIAKLLDERFAASMKHMEKLRLRIEDTTSKVLVTGDLNAGKSTLVNALLRREIMPVDQQPCTTAFCEVHDAAENDGQEEAHIIKEGTTYNIKDESTFTRVKLPELDNFISDNENSTQIVKIYMMDSRSPAESLLNNGIADISLIDAPGLNRDSLKTTALFARQEEIDVVVFVVSAENHFTLSAKEFLQNASNEKAYIFIVVNKYEQIRDKKKCRRLVLEQIKELSPRTYEDAEDLVHFVDSASVMGSSGASESFSDLESALRSFVLVKRSKSKLHPVSTYLSHLLSDVDLLAGANTIVAESELARATADLNRVRPVLEKMQNSKYALEEDLDHVEEDSASTARARTRMVLNKALDRVGGGSLALENTHVQMPSFPGLLRVWEYARDVRKALLESLDLTVKLAEDESRVITSNGVNTISQLGDRYLPDGVERSRRVFMPEAMFSQRRGMKQRKGRKSTVVAGGIYGLGIGLAQRPELLDISFFDVFDAQHQFSLYFGDGKDASIDENDDSSPSALSVLSVGVGALTMVGGKTLGLRGVMEGIFRTSELFGNESTRKWAAPVIGAFAMGLSIYFVLELPNTIPRNVGRRIRTSLLKPEAGQADEEDATFVNAHAARISRETRKVLKIASWDLKERFRVCMEDNTKQVKNAEEMEALATRAIEQFNDIQKRTGDVRMEARLKSVKA